MRPFFIEVLFLGARDFWVLTAFFNPLGLKNKMTNYLAFSKSIRTQGAKLLVVELSIKDSGFVIPQDSCDKLIRLKSNSFLWHKERLLNIGLQNIPDSCKYVVLVDGDVLFLDSNWIKKTKKILKKYPVIQPFKWVTKLDQKETKSFFLTGDMEYYSKQTEGYFSCLLQQHKIQRYNVGYALALRANLAKKVKFYDKAIIGGGDSILVDGFSRSIFHEYEKYGDLFTKDAVKWVKNAKRISKEHISFIDGKILHLWHGNDKNRNYKTRYFFLNALRFNPTQDLEVNSQGVFEWSQRRSIRIYLMKFFSKLYFVSRNEQSSAKRLPLLAGHAVFFLLPESVDRIWVFIKAMLVKGRKLFSYLFEKKRENTKVTFVNYWSLNPYHKLLTGELSKLNCFVLGKKCWRGVYQHPSRFIVSDVIHIHTTVFSSNWLTNIKAMFYYTVMLIFAKILGKKVIFTLHNLDPLDGRFNFGNKMFLIFLGFVSNKVIVHHATAIKLANQVLFINEKKIVFLPHPNYCEHYKNEISCFSARKKLSIKKNTTVFLLLGNLRQYKGISLLVDSFSSIKGDIALFIVGKPFEGYLDEFEYLQKKVLLDNRIKLLPKYVPDDEVQVYMNAADVFVLPYVENSFTSGAALLAMSFKKPIIASSTLFFKSLLKFQKELVFSTPSELREKMIFVMKNKAYLKEKGLKNYALCLKDTWRKQALKLSKIYLGEL